MYKSMNEVRSAFPHFFGENAMHAFDSRVETSLVTNDSTGRQFFVTSERLTYQDQQGQRYQGKRRYTVREVVDDDIRNYSEFCALSYSEAAKLLYKVTHKQEE